MFSGTFSHPLFFGGRETHVKRLIPLILGAALLATPAVASAETNAFAQSGRFGLGIGSGWYTNGISAKYFFGERMSLQGVVGGYGGWGLGWGGLGVGADVLFEMPSLVGNQDVNLNWNVGPGVAAGFGSGFASVAVSGVVGLSLQLKSFPVDFTIEARPTFRLGDWSGFYFGGGGHIRYFF